MHAEQSQASEQSPATVDPSLQKLLGRIAALERSHQQLRNQRPQQQHVHWTHIFCAAVVVFLILCTLILYCDYVTNARAEAWMREFGVQGYLALKCPRGVCF
jgi:hypothetical protein